MKGWAGLLLWLVLPPAAAQSPVLEPPEARGLRAQLAEDGWRFDAAVVADWSYLIDGGRDDNQDDSQNENNSAARYLVSAGVTVDTAAAFGLAGGTLRASYVGFHGENDGAAVGDVQGYSNIDARSFDAVYEVWYQQELPADLRVKIGKQDASDEFAYVAYGGSFIHNSPGYSPTILALPTYPDPATGLVAFWEPEAGPYVGTGVYDGATQAGIPTGTHGPSTFLGSPSDLFTIAEAGLRYGVAGLPGRIGIGYWHHNGEFERFDGGVNEHADGAYLVWDQTLYQAAAGPRRVGGFLQLGHADETVSAIETHIGAGVEVTALLAARPRDISGLMASYAALSDAAGAGFSDEYELAFEAFHALRVTDWLTLTGDLQYIVNPGGMGADDATVLLLRAAVAL